MTELVDKISAFVKEIQPLLQEYNDNPDLGGDTRTTYNFYIDNVDSENEIQERSNVNISVDFGRYKIRIPKTKENGEETKPV